MYARGDRFGRRSLPAVHARGDRSGRRRSVGLRVSKVFLVRRSISALMRQVHNYYLFTQFASDLISEITKANAILTVDFFGNFLELMHGTEFAEMCFATMLKCCFESQLQSLHNILHLGSKTVIPWGDSKVEII